LAGFVAATSLNYILSHFLAFRSTRGYLQEFILVLAMSGLAFAVNFLVFYLLYAIADVHVIYAKVIGTCSGFVFNYAIRQFYIFSRISRFPSVSQLTKREIRGGTENVPTSRLESRTMAPGNPIMSPPSKRLHER
jgi:putative flippase GtrA